MSTKLALEQAEAEKRRRLNEKIEKGEAVRMLPIVVGRPCRAAAEKARKIAELRAAGETREVTFEEEPTEYGLAPISVIATGVPRPDRDGDVRCDNCTCMSATPSTIAYLPGARASYEPTPRPMRKPPTPEPALPPLPTEFWPFRVQILAGNGTTDPGQIIEGRYRINGGFVFVENDQGEPIAMQRLVPNENAAGLAQKLLREKWRGKSQVPGFYDGPINRPTRTFH